MHIACLPLCLQASAMLLSELITMVPLVDSSRATDCHNMTEASP